MNGFPIVAIRTLRCDAAGTRFDEGPIDTRGAGVASVDVRRHPASPSSTWATAAAEVKGALADPETLRAFDVPATIGTGTTGRRNLGDSTVGVAADRYLDAVVTTAEAGVWLEFQFHMNKTGGAA